MTSTRLPEAIPLQPFASARRICHEHAKYLRPPRRITVTEAARKHRHVRSPAGGYTGPWVDDELPYLVEPMDVFTSRRFTGLVFVGPAQSVKTGGLVENPIVHSVICDPADMLVIQTSEAMARDFSKRRINRMLEDMNALRARLRGNNNVLDKFFDRMILSIGWPSISQLSGRPIPRGIVTDYDRIDDDIDGEGGCFDLLQKRAQTFGSRAMTLAESSPGKPVLDAKWKQPEDAPHEFPPTTGIGALYNRGDRRRFLWPCPHCNDYFEASFDRLRWDDAPDPAEAAESVHLACKHGCVIEPKWKLQCNQAGLWLAEGQRIEKGERVGNARRSTIASFWLKGPAAALQTWRQLVERYLTARGEFERTGSEESLKATVNVDQGEAYLSEAAKADTSLDAQDLIDGAEDYPLRVVPRGARFGIAAVDVQGNYFDVMMRFFGPDLESWVVERFKIFKGGADEERQIDPARKAEDWDRLLEEVAAKSYPLEGEPDSTMRVMRMVVDSGGKAGVTAQAYRFWRRCKRKGLGDRVILAKGTATAEAPRVAVRFPDSKRKDRKAGARGEIPVLFFHTDKLKDEVRAQLATAEAGPLKAHLPTALKEDKPPHFFFEELTSEERLANGKWEKRGPKNEALDLFTMTQAVAIHLKADRFNWSGKVPSWAADWAQNSYVTLAAEKAEEEPAAGPAEKEPKRGQRKKAWSRPRGKGGFVGNY